jgi:hypothetical protein
MDEKMERHTEAVTKGITDKEEALAKLKIVNPIAK